VSAAALSVVKMHPAVLDYDERCAVVS